MSVRFTRRSSSLSRFQTFVALLATSAVVATTASATWAQGQNPANRPRPGGNQPMREQVTGAGKIKGMQGGVMQVVGSGGEQYLVALEAPQNAQQASQVQVSFQGKAEPSWLKPGMLLRFQNKVDKRGRLLDPIDSLEVLSPRPDLQVGILPASGLDKEGGGGGGLFQDVPEKTEKPGKKAPPADMTP
ncbi:MAG TPA: hypothetical protein PLV92_13275, partial [Pirellulaceae bacterium]|nr:hypothetical protein [Pirellulaceae bacterium]